MVVLVFLFIVVIGYTIWFAVSMANADHPFCEGHTESEKKVINYLLNFSNCLKDLPFSPKEYDDLVKRSIPKEKVSMEYAMGACNLDESQIEEIKPIHLCGYYFDKGCYAKRSVGWQSSKYQHTWLFFTKDQLHMYQYVRDLAFTSGAESCQELFYKDITSFSITTESIDKETTIGSGNFKRVLTQCVDAEIFKIVVPGDVLKCAMESSDEIKESVRAMNSLLRDKKNA